MKFNLKLNFKKSFVIILWISIFIMIIFLGNTIKNDIQIQIFELVQKSIDEKSVNLDKGIQDVFKTLKTVSNSVSSQDLSNLGELAKTFDSIVKENNFKRIAIVNTEGIAYFNDGEVADISDREYFNSAINGNMYVSSMVFSRVDGKKSNTFSVPIYKDNNIVGIIFASVLTDKFYETINLDTLTDLGDSIILDSNGNIIVSHENSIFNSDKANFFEKLKSAGIEAEKNKFNYKIKGYSELKLNDGNTVVIHYSKLTYSDWWAITLIDSNNIRCYYVDIIKNLAIVLILIILFIVTLTNTIYNKEKKRFENIQNIAYKDIITDGNNDKYLSENIYKIIKGKGNFAFISLEIVNIKNIVTAIGLNNTKYILKDIYKYLSNMLDDNEIVIHSYLGEYKLLIKYESIKGLFKRIEAINLSNINENLKFIMGIYLIDDSGISFEEMCSNVSIAKEALNNSKCKSKYIIYNKQIHKREVDKLKLEEDIKSAIENKEFKAWFQPKYGKDGKSIIGAEALVRWYKYGTIISPYVFIPICEANCLIKNIDELVFEDVCKNISEWIKNNKNVVPISVNLSRSYIDKENFIDDLEKYIDKYKVPRELIHFEITESSLMGNESKLKDIVCILHKKGFKVFLDDFGVGYSSIKAISEVNFDVLKIDKSFVDGIGNDKWENIIRYTIIMANKLGMKIIAEGIETEEQYKFLLECNCDIFQGYYFNKPMNSDEFSKLI